MVKVMSNKEIYEGAAPEDVVRKEAKIAQTMMFLFPFAWRFVLFVMLIFAATQGGIVSTIAAVFAVWLAVLTVVY